MDPKNKKVSLCRESSSKRMHKPVSQLKIAANLDFMYRKKSTNLLEQYALARRSGFTHVEAGYPFRYELAEVKEAKEKAGVQHVMLNMPEGNLDQGEMGFAAIPGKEEVFCHDFHRLVEYAKELNCSIVHILCGRMDTPTSEHDEVCLKNLRWAVDILEKENLVGILECINWVVEPGYYLDSYEKIIRIIKQIDSPNLKLLLDIWHLQFNNGNLTCNIEWLLPYTGYVQIAQVPDRHEPDSDGEINYHYLFKLLKDLGYSGWIGLEYVPAGDVDDGLEFFAKQGVVGFEPRSKK